MDYTYRLLNVFAESRFGGNPLCVFEDAQGLSEVEMQAIALQFNLSETVFLLPSSTSLASMRIFTPTTELSFAGHPSLGAAQVVRARNGGINQFALECKAGIVEVQAQLDFWELTAPIRRQNLMRQLDVDTAAILQCLSLTADDLLGLPVWVNAGNEHLLIPLRFPERIKRTSLQNSHLALWPRSLHGRQNLYIFAFDGRDDAGRVKVKARYWSAKGDAVSEDPATGSACVNLGAWWIAQGHVVPELMVVEQGEEMLRPSRLYLRTDVDSEGIPQIKVGGSVIELASGVLHL